jgi:hypothetical protein
LDVIAGNGERWNAGHIFQQPPIRAGFRDGARKLFEHGQPVPRGWPTSCPAEILTRWPADHAGKVTRRRVKIFDALAEQHVRPAYHAKAGLLKSTIQQTRPGKQ